MNELAAECNDREARRALSCAHPLPPHSVFRSDLATRPESWHVRRPSIEKKVEATKLARKKIANEMGARERRICAKDAAITNDALAFSKRNSALGLPDIANIMDKL
jgi:hypothetical protein